MQDKSDITSADLTGRDWQDWLDRAETVIGDDGYMQPLGSEHAALFCERKPVLLVTFESFDRLEVLSEL
ncbi:MAG TPA: phosphoadenosine phosphosulfate reductase, partial [Roseovarius sp.]|nr:phosphoadenosine phosphosulfate reductase [Roseovarius sp.]